MSGVPGLAMLLLVLHCGSERTSAVDDASSGGGGSAGDTVSSTSSSTSSSSSSAGGSTTEEILMLTGDPVAGQGVYATTCGQTTCHGPDGDTGSPISPMHSAVIPTLSDAEIVDTIRFGTIAEGGVMPELSLGSQDIADVLAYLRQTFP
jgi:hypothetical protein